MTDLLTRCPGAAQHPHEREEGLMDPTTTPPRRHFPALEWQSTTSTPDWYQTPEV